MEFHDSETQRLLRTTARSYFAEAFPAERLNDLHSGTERLSPADLKGFADLGWLALAAPEGAGGGGASLLEAAIVIEEAGYACAPVPVAVANVAAALLSEVADTAKPLLSGHAAGESVVTTDGSRHVLGSANSATTSVTFTGTTFSGRLRAVPFAELSKFVISLVTIDGRQALAALPLRAAEIGPLVLLDRAGDANVTFRDAPAADVAPLAEGEDAGTLHERCSALTTAFAVVEMTGLTQRVLELTTEHISTRQQFGQPIGKFQAARHRAAELLTQVETTRWAAYHALWRFEQDGDASEIWLAKHWAARAADRVFQIAHLLHGGVGVGIEHPLHLYTQSIAAFAVRAGTMDEMVDRTLESLRIPA